MPQKFFIVESSDEVNAREHGLAKGQEIGYSSGFKTASILWIIMMILTMFFTLDTKYEISFLRDIRADFNHQLKVKLPDQTELIDKLLPDGKINLASL